LDIISNNCTYITILFKFYWNISDTDSKIIDNTEAAAAPASPIQDAPAATNPAK
jgi:hypothetical protein